AFAGTTRAGFVGFVSPKCVALPSRATLPAEVGFIRLRPTFKSPELGQARVRVGEGAIMPTAFVALFTFQTTHLVPAAHVCARGLHPCFAHPNRGVGGAPLRHPYILTLPQVAPCYFKGLAFPSCAVLRVPLPSLGTSSATGIERWVHDMRAWNKLSASFVRSVRREGRYSDGGNLYLQVANGGKSWVFQYQRHGRQRDMGLGSARSVSLALARELRDDCHGKLARGLDPIEART